MLSFLTGTLTQLLLCTSSFYSSGYTIGLLFLHVQRSTLYSGIEARDRYQSSACLSLPQRECDEWLDQLHPYSVSSFLAQWCKMLQCWVKLLLYSFCHCFSILSSEHCKEQRDRQYNSNSYCHGRQAQQLRALSLTDCLTSTWELTTRVTSVPRGSNAFFWPLHEPMWHIHKHAANHSQHKTIVGTVCLSVTHTLLMNSDVYLSKRHRTITVFNFFPLNTFSHFCQDFFLVISKNEWIKSWCYFHKQEFLLVQKNNLVFFGI